MFLFFVNKYNKLLLFKYIRTNSQILRWIVTQIISLNEWKQWNCQIKMKRKSNEITRKIKILRTKFRRDIHILRYLMPLTSGSHMSSINTYVHARKHNWQHQILRRQPTNQPTNQRMNVLTTQTNVVQGINLTSIKIYQ